MGINASKSIFESIGSGIDRVSVIDYPNWQSRSISFAGCATIFDCKPKPAVLTHGKTLSVMFSDLCDHPMP
jgi:hypothetical protein